MTKPLKFDPDKVEIVAVDYIQVLGGDDNGVVGAFYQREGRAPVLLCFAPFVPFAENMIRFIEDGMKDDEQSDSPDPE
jgi:hypothetical protein